LRKKLNWGSLLPRRHLRVPTRTLSASSCASLKRVAVAVAVVAVADEVDGEAVLVVVH